MVTDTSVIIVNKDKDKYLGRCIRSCLKQSLDRGRYEVIVIDDASTDNSREIISDFGEEIKPIYLQNNVGVAEASNLAIRRAMGQFIIRVDSDDYINENTLLFMTELLSANPSIGFVYADHLLVDEQEKPLGRLELGTLEDLFKHGAGVMFRKSNLESVGLYDKQFKNAEDRDLLQRYLKNFDGYHLPLPLYRYRQVSGSLSRKEDRSEYEKMANEKNL
jgi:glycosyltransferase involved in cell wall biosynthesis